MKLTIDTVEDNLLRGMILVLIVLIFFLASVRAAIITALTIPLALLFAFIVLHAHDIAANLLSIGAIDFGIIIDGTVVMVENIYRELAPARRAGLQAQRGHRGRRQGCGPAHLLFGRRHHRRLSAHLRAARPLRQALPSHGRDHVVRSDRRADSHADAGPRAGLLLVQEGVREKDKPRLRMDEGEVRQGAGLVPEPSQGRPC